jgi:hypothetical protein
VQASSVSPQQILSDELRKIAIATEAPHTERYAALWVLLRDDPDAHLDVAVSIADAPLLETEAWNIPLQAIALRVLVSRAPERWRERFCEVARAAPGGWIFEALHGVDPLLVRDLLESLAVVELPHLSHPALTLLLSRPHDTRATWVAHCLRDSSRDVQTIALEAAEHCHFTETDVSLIATIFDDPSADVRLVAAEALSLVRLPHAVDVLQRHLPHERSPRVRRVMLDTPGVVAIAEEASATEDGTLGLTARAKATMDALAKPVAPWFIERPQLYWDDGSACSAVVGEYILFCQHGCHGLDMDARAIEYASHIERASRSLWAVALLDAWIGRHADVKHHWCMALAVALGGEIAVPTVLREIGVWYRGGRRALAAEAVKLLAFSGDDRSLRALEEIARTHAFDSLGKFATNALRGEASARQLTPDELSDTLVPHWGLNADGKGWLDYGRRRFRLMLEPSTENILSVSLTETNWRVLQAPPKPTRADDPVRAMDAIARWRSLTKDFPDVLSVEIARFEQAMCNQRRWALQPWRTRVMQHPVLRGIAERLVWRIESPAQNTHQLARIVKATLVGEHGEPLRMDTHSHLSIVHPVSLSALEKSRWSNVFAATLPQPFSQLARTVFAPTTTHEDTVTWSPVVGLTLRALSDRSRSRPPVWTRTGWEPAPLEDGVCRTFLRRHGDIMAVLSLDGITLWSERARESVIRSLRFRRIDEEVWLPLCDVDVVTVSEAARAAMQMLEGNRRADEQLTH